MPLPTLLIFTIFSIWIMINPCGFMTTVELLLEPGEGLCYLRIYSHGSDVPALALKGQTRRQQGVTSPAGGGFQWGMGRDIWLGSGCSDIPGAALITCSNSDLLPAARVSLTG